MLERGCSVTLGVSGGADSVCLFFVLLSLKEEYDLKPRVIHVMHGIREEEAERDMEFTAGLCREHGVDFKCIRKDVPKIASERGLSIEEAGRLVRYEAFEGEKTDRTAVAHNKNDLAETVLFNLLRGSGIRGICGISPVNGRIIRPLLCVTRTEIEEYLKGRGLSWCTDSTNSDNDYSRNRIRNVILKEAERINPRTVQHLAGAAAEAASVSDLLDREILKAFDDCCREEKEGISIDVIKAKKLHPCLFRGIIYEALCRLSGKKKDIGAVHVRDTAELFDRQSGKSCDLIYGLRAKRSFDRVLIEKKKAGEENVSFRISLQELLKKGEIRLVDGRILSAALIEGDDPEFTKVSHTYALDYDKIVIDSLIRVRQQGDRISIRGGHRKVKDLLIDKKIPVDARDELLMLAHESEVYWIENLRTGFSCSPGRDTKRILKIRVKEA